VSSFFAWRRRRSECRRRAAYAAVRLRLPAAPDGEGKTSEGRAAPPLRACRKVSARQPAFTSRKLLRQGADMIPRNRRSLASARIFQHHYIASINIRAVYFLYTQ
jgi:hypothetical protein